MPTPKPRSSGRMEELRRTARVLDLIQQIAIAPHRWQRSSLARKYEVSERQIQKDLTLIREGLRLELSHDAEGYFFEQLPRLPTTNYTFSEALALLLAARAAQAIPGINSAELAAAIGRLESLFPPDMADLLRQTADRLPKSASAPHRQEMLGLLWRALAEHRQVCITYATASRNAELSERVIEPYHLLPYVRSWQVIAYDHRRKAVREFKIDRIMRAELLETTYTIPSTFDVEAYLGDSWGLMRGAAAEPEEVELVFEPEAGRWVAEEQWHKSQRVEALPDGRVRLTFHIGITPEFVSWLLYYGARVEVVKPFRLRDQIVKEARMITERYAFSERVKGGE